MSIWQPIRLLAASTALLLAFGTAGASTLTLEFDTSFGDPLDPGTSAPDGPAPWLTAVFDDGGSAGTVTLTMTVSGAIGNGEITAVYFNLDEGMDAADLTITRNAGSSDGPVENSIGQVTDSFKAANDGFF